MNAGDGADADAGAVAGTDRTRVAAYAVTHDGDNRILLCHIAPSVGVGDIWTLPGGALEYGEPPEAAVLRELAEETGHDGEIVSLVEVNDRLIELDDRPGALHAIRIVYRVQITGGALRDETDGTTDACAWFTIEDAERLNLGDLARRAIELLAADDG